MISSILSRINGPAVILLLLAMLGLSWCNNNRLQQQVQTLGTNQQALLYNAANQVTLSRREMKHYIRSNQALASRLDSMGIKVRNVTNVITSTYHVKDTTIISSLLVRDTLREKSTFNLQHNCWQLQGYVTPDSVATTSVSYNDQLTLVQHRRWRHRIAISPRWDLLHWGRYTTASLWSSCKGDTIPITRNIITKPQ